MDEVSTSSAELVPEGAGPLALPNAQRARMREVLARSHPLAFNDEEIRQFYTDFFLSLVGELETVPGYGLAMEALAERYAFLVASMKSFDTMPVPLDPGRYEKLILRFSQLFDRMLQGRDERSADEAFKRQFMTAVMNVVAEAIEEAVPDRQDAYRIQDIIISKLRRAQLPSGTK